MASVNAEQTVSLYLDVVVLVVEGEEEKEENELDVYKRQGTLRSNHLIE